MTWSRPVREHRLSLTIAALLSYGIALSAGCAGELDQPEQVCEDCGRDGVSAADPVGVVGEGADPNRPVGVGDPTGPNGVGWSTRFPKLSNRQWESTVQALFYLVEPTKLSESFIQERLDKGYEGAAAAEQTISGDAWARYQSAAERVAQLVVSDDEKLAKIAPKGNFADENAKGAAFIASFGRRAYRRPLSKEEQDSYLTLFKAGPTLVGGDAYKAGVRIVLEAMLQSPFFLYRVEAAQGTAGKVALSGHELATRLSYALWGSMPSDELFAAASAGELDSKEGLARWAGKLLEDPRAKEVLLSFHEQTFQVASYGTQEKESGLGFDTEALAPVLREEARRFFEHVVYSGRGGIKQLLTDPTAFVNQDTAPYYGLSGVVGKELTRQTLDASQRAGLLTQLGFLTKNATRSTSDPVHRGLTVLRKVLCDEPDPPPMMFMLPNPKPGMTTREVYEEATRCGTTCHGTLINPPGFAFENFDAVGRFRSSEVGKPIDASGSLDIRSGYTPSEKSAGKVGKLAFGNAVELLKKLADEPRVHECYARNWMHFVLGREVSQYERGASEALRDSSRMEGSAQALLTRLVQLDTFRTRVSE